MCHTLLANLLGEYQRYANLGVASPDGQVYCSALPLKHPINIADLSFFQRAVQTQSFVIGDYQVGRISGQPSIHFSYPVLDPAGKVEAVIYAAVALDWLNQQSTEIDAQLPPVSTFTKIDTNGRILVQIPNQPQQVGQLLPETDLLHTVLQSREGTREMVGTDGQRRLYTFSSMHSQLYGGNEYLIVGIASEAVFGGVTRALWHNLMGLGLVALLTLAVAWFGSDLAVLRPMRTLVKTAGQLSAGDLAARTGLAHQAGEVGQLAQAFDEMASNLSRLVLVERQSHQTAEILREASAALTSTLDLPSVLDQLLIHLEKVAPYDRASVLLVHDDRLQLAAGRGSAAPPNVSGGLPANAAWFAELRATRQPVIAANPPPELRTTAARGHSWMGVPLMARGDLIGALTLRRESPARYSQAEASLVQTFANQAAAAIHNAQLFEAIQQQGSELRSLAVRLAEAQETERKKIARELHDQIGQNLTVLSVTLNLVRLQLSETLGEPAQTRLQEALKLVEQTTRDIRDVMADLRPSVLDDYGLMATLRWYGPQFAQQTGLAVVVNGEELAPRLPALAETALFRIVQEALANVARHAQAQQVLLTLQADGQVARLIIADDGQGFAAEAPRSAAHGWGLINMRERAQAVGGQFQVESLTGEGTHVIVEVPR